MRYIALSPVVPIYTYLSRTCLPVHLLGLQTAPSRRRTLHAREKERKRERDKFSRFPLSTGFVIGVSLSPFRLRKRKVYIEKEILLPCPCVESRRRWVKDSHPFEGPTDDARGPPTFDLYRPLSIFRNLLLRILNVRISARQIRGAAEEERERGWRGGAAKRAGVVGSSRIRNTSSFCYRPPLRHGETLP